MCIKRNLFIFSFITYLCSCSGGVEQSYKDSTLSPEERTELLFKEMTLQEKLGQLYIPSNLNLLSKGKVSEDSLKKYYPYGAGVIFPDRNDVPEIYIEKVNAYQKYMVENTRLGIPAFIGGEGLHGFMAVKSTYFPQAIALGCTFNPELAEKVYSVVAKELRTRGVNLVLSPVLDLAREPRWGRTEECYSEDPYLVGQMSLAAVRGFQGRTMEELSNGSHVVATLKHFAGHGQPEGGRNTAPVATTRQDVIQNHLYPFEICVKEGNALSVMASYNELEGIPNHANKWLLTDVLKDKWNFKGFVTADQGGVQDLMNIHHMAADMKYAAKYAIESGIDFELKGRDAMFETLEEAVENGEVDIDHIDRAVKAILLQKFRAGIFENPYTDPAKMVYNTPEHKQMALDAARESVVLLKNDNKILPLDINKIGSIAVIGPNAADVHLGGYTSDPHEGVSVLQGIKDFCGGKIKVNYAEGCKITKQKPSFWTNDETPNSKEDDLRLINQAVNVAKASDVTVLVLGDNTSTCREAWGENHRGDRDNLELLGMQNELVKRITALNKPVIALILGGRPLAINEVSELVPAIFQGFYIGQEGGTAFAEILFGKTNPSGKLSVTIPRNVGQLPVYYNHKQSRYRSYLWKESTPLYSFGHGLSYSDFVYEEMKLDKNEMSSKDTLKVDVWVKNKSEISGKETVQLYIRDMYSSITRPVMELKAFKKVLIEPGETKKISFDVTPEMLSFKDENMNDVIESGDFKIMIGSASDNVVFISEVKVK